MKLAKSFALHNQKAVTIIGVVDVLPEFGDSPGIRAKLSEANATKITLDHLADKQRMLTSRIGSKGAAGAPDSFIPAHCFGLQPILVHDWLS
jgi:hypothetical protein